MKSIEFQINPNTLLDVSPVQADDIKVGDFIACQRWTRPRLVLATDGNAAGRSFVLLEPDANSANDKGHRLVDATEFAARGAWRRYDTLTALWAAANKKG